MVHWVHHVSWELSQDPPVSARGFLDISQPTPEAESPVSRSRNSWHLGSLGKAASGR